MTAHRRLLGAALVVVALVIAACSTEVAANDIEVGECTNQDMTSAVGEIDTVDCSESHTAEVFAVFDLEDGDFPGTAEVSELATEGCNGSRFEDYVGISYTDSEIFSAPLAPTEQTWNDADDRTVICFAVASDGSAIDGSVEGAER